MQDAVLIVGLVALAVAAIAIAVAQIALFRTVEALAKGLDLFIRTAAASANPSGFCIADEVDHPAPKPAPDREQVIE